MVLAAGGGGLATGLVLSLFVGQLPYSSPSLLDVVGRTYGAEPDSRRMRDAEDGQWLTMQLAKVRQEGSEVLATGRIAAHLLSNRDVETVGQYLERRQQPPTAGEGAPVLPRELFNTPDATAWNAWLPPGMAHGSD